jgi:hypothetical protein
MCVRVHCLDTRRKDNILTNNIMDKSMYLDYLLSKINVNKVLAGLISLIVVKFIIVFIKKKTND